MALSGRLLAGQHLDRRQSFGFRGVVKQEDDHRYAQHARHRRADEAPLPAEDADDGPDKEERQEFAEVVAGAEKTVVSAAFAQGIPPRQRDDRRRCAHRLRPSVDAPHHGEGDEQRHVARQARAARESQHPDQQVGDGRDAQSGRHEALDVAVVGEKAVDEFAYGIGEQQRRTDDTQLRGVERPAFENRFLDHVETRAADVIETVTDRTGDETLEAEFPIQFHARRVVSREGCRRRAFSKERERVHSVVYTRCFGIQNYPIKRHK